MNTTIVGRVAVRVLPETSGFKEDLRAQLKKETAGVDAEVPVDANLDADELERQLRAKVEELKNKFVVRLRSQIQDLKKQVVNLTKQAEAQSAIDPVTFKADIDEKSLKKEIYRTVHLKAVDGDIFDFAAIRRGFLGLNALEEKHLRDMEAARRRYGRQEIDSFRERLSAMMRRLKVAYSVLRVQIQPHLDRARAAFARVELETWFKRLKVFTTEVRAVLNTKSVKGVQQGLTVLSGVRLFKDLVSLEPFKDIDRQLPKIALMATLIGQASNYMLSLSSDALSLGRSLGSIVPAALALPGIFLAAGVALYAVIKPLSEFNERIPEMGKGLREMQATMVSAFWRNAAKGMQSLTTLLPTLIRGFRVVGAASGRFMGTLSQSLSTRLKSSLMPFLKAIGTSFDSLTRAARPISRIVGNFVDLGSSYLPRLARATETVIGRFADFFDKNMQNGRVFEWVDRGITNIKNLGGVVAGVYRIMDGLSTAAEKAGGATLGSLAAGLDKVQRVVKSDTFQSGLINVFASARIAIEEMVRVAGPSVSRMFATMAAGADEILPRIGRVAGTLASMFARILGDPVVGAGLISFFDGLAGALRILEPAVSNVAKGLGGILRVMGTMFKSFAPIVDVALGAVAKHAEGMLATVERVVGSLSAGVLNLLKSLTPAIDALAPSVLSIVEGIARGISGALTVLGPILSTLLQAVTPILTVIGKLPPAFQLALAAAGLLATVIGRLAIKFGPTLLGIEGVQKALRNAVPAAKSFAGRMGEAVLGSGRMASAVEKIRPRLETLRSKLSGVVSGLGRFVGIAGSVVAAAGLLSGAFKGPTTGAQEFSLAMDKLAKGDLSGFDRQFQNTGNLLSRGAKDMGEAFASLKGEKNWGLDGLNKALDGSIGQLAGFKTSTGEIRDIITKLDSEMATLFQNDPGAATRSFEAIKEKALAAGWSIEDLKAMFPELQASIERSANGGAGAFGAAVNGMVTDAQKLQDEVFGRMSRQERQIDALGGKSKAKVAQQLASARAQMISELAKTAEGTDKVILTSAGKLNAKIAAKAAELKKATGKGARETIASELDTLISDYRSKFGDLPNLLDGAEGGSLSAAISKMVGSGITPAAQAGVKASIMNPVNTAVAEAKAKVAEIKTVTQGIDIAGPIRAAFAVAQTQVSTSTTTLVAASRAAVASVAARTSGLAHSLAAPVSATARAVFNGIAAAIGGYNARLNSKLSESVKSTKTTAEKIKGATKFSLESNGAAVASSYVRGLLSKLPEVIAAAKKLSKATKDNKGPISYDRVMLIPEGQAVVQGFVKGLLSEVGTVESTMQDITDIVAGTKFDAAIKQANRSASNAAVLGGLSVGTSQYITQVGDVTIDVSELEGVKTIDDLGRTLRRKRRQRGGS